MDQQARFFTKISKQAKLFSLLVLFFLSVVLLIMQIYSHQLKTRYTKQTLSLPKLSVDYAETELGDQEAQAEQPWKTIETHAGDTLGSLFKKLGLSQKTLQAVIRNNPHAKS